MSVLAAAWLVTSVSAQTPGAVQPQPLPSSAISADAGLPTPQQATLTYGLQALALAPDVYVVRGQNADFTLANGCNIINTGFIVTKAGVVVINTGPSKRYGEALRALIARTTTQPVREVIHLNLHPDYFLGNQAFADVPRRATALTREGMSREAKAYEDNLYRMCGDWMTGTEALLPEATTDLAVPAGGTTTLSVGGRDLQLTHLSGHTASDLVLIDKTSGVAFMGGLVFSDRIPTTPHADLPRWQGSLTQLEALTFTRLVPSHGPLHADRRGIAQTRAYLGWIDSHYRRWAREGLEMNDVLREPLPAEFDGWAARSTEVIRNVAHLYPRYEAEAMAPAGRR